MRLFLSYQRATNKRAFVVVALFGLGGCHFDTGKCANNIVSTVPSLSGAKKVVLFVRNCGATTSFSTQLSILDGKEQPPDSAGNLWIADDNHGVATFGSGGAMPVGIKWIGDDKLLVMYDHKARVFKAETGVDGVSIAYSPFLVNDQR